MSNKGIKIKKTDTPRGTKRDRGKKTSTWNKTTALSLILGVLGALGVIELRPQLSAEPRDMLETMKPFSAPFTVRNTGYLSFWVQNAGCAEKRIEVGRWAIENSVMEDDGTSEHYLEPSEGLTFQCKFASIRGDAISTAHMFVFVSYKPWKSFPWLLHKSFCFSGWRGDNWLWGPEPCKS